MTVAPPRPTTSRSTHPLPRPGDTVCAVLVVHDGEQWLVESLDALALQTRPPERLVVIDTGSLDNSPSIIARHAGIRAAVPDLTVIHAERATPFGAAVHQAVESLAAGDDDCSTQWLWLLHDDSAPAPFTLARLLETCRRSPSVALAGPKLTLWDDQRRLRAVGIQQTRTGRRIGGPALGEPDQGQHDHLSDVLGIGSAGMLVRRDVFAELGGFDPAFAGPGADLDLSWRAHLAGHRVIVVPKATVREAAASRTGQRAGAPAPAAVERLARRRGRLVALTRCSLLALPFVAAWIALGALGSALALLLVKRPRRAWAELGDLGALLDARRGWGARWRFRGKKTVRHRDLRGLFVSPRTAVRGTLDAIQDAVTPEDRANARPSTSGALESGPVAAESEELTALPLSWPQRAVRHPGLITVLLTVVLALLTWRSLLATSALTGSGLGLSGGELSDLDTDAAGLWHAWADGWHGSGLGNAVEAAPLLPVLAGLTWVVGHLPWVQAGASPAGTTVGWILVAAMPLSAWTAYLGGRVATRARWPRAGAALAWACLPTLTTALAGGRLGAVVAHILLPLVVAGFATVLRGRGSATVTFGTALAVAVVGAFDPPLLVLCTAVSVLVMVLGRRWTWLRGVVLAVLPLALLGPWLLRVLQEPLLLLAGPGLVQWGAPSAAPWELALLHPGGPGSYPVLLSAPIVAVGLLGLLRRGSAGRALNRLGLLALVGLAAGLAAPHVVIARPPGTSSAAHALTPWSGTGLDVLAVALLAAALLGLQGLGSSSWWSAARWRRAVAGPAVALTVLAVLASATWAGWAGVGERLHPSHGTVPAVAADQAAGTLANRVLVLARHDGVVDYHLVGKEPGAVARSLPPAPPTADPLLTSAVRAALSGTTAADANDVRARLTDLGIGFVGLQDANSSLVRQLDGTAGLTRLGSTDDMVLFRVLPPDGKGSQVLAPSRARVVERGGAVQELDVTGAHAATAAHLPAGPARSLVVAEPAGWVAHARVLVDGHVVPSAVGTDQPTYPLPAGASRLSIQVPPTQPVWRWVQLALLVVTVFLAVPFGTRRSRRAA